MIVKVKKYKSSNEHKHVQPIASSKTVRVVKPTTEIVTDEEVKPNLMKRVNFVRPLTEAHARAAWNQLFAN